MNKRSNNSTKQETTPKALDTGMITKEKIIMSNMCLKFTKNSVY